MFHKILFEDEVEDIPEGVFFMDGMGHDTKFEYCNCQTFGKSCIIEDCNGFMHYQSVYGPSAIYECDKCHGVI